MVFASIDCDQTREAGKSQRIVKKQRRVNSEIAMEYTATVAPMQNRVSERTGQALSSMVRWMFKDGNSIGQPPRHVPRSQTGYEGVQQTREHTHEASQACCPLPVRYPNGSMICPFSTKRDTSGCTPTRTHRSRRTRTTAGLPQAACSCWGEDQSASELKRGH